MQHYFLYGAILGSAIVAIWVSLFWVSKVELVDRGLMSYCDVTANVEFTGECPP